MKKLSFTKIIMALMLLSNAAVIAFTCTMVWRTGDTSPLGWLSLGEGGAVSVWLASYAWKEKAANRSKYAMEYVDKIAAEHSFENALRIAEIVLRE